MEFEEIYSLYFNDVYLFILALSKNPDIAEEITQETFFKALKNINKFKGDCSIKTWLCQIGKNTYLSHLKSRSTLPTPRQSRNLALTRLPRKVPRPSASAGTKAFRSIRSSTAWKILIKKYSPSAPWAPCPSRRLEKSSDTRKDGARDLSQSKVENPRTYQGGAVNEQNTLRRHPRSHGFV